MPAWKRAFKLRVAVFVEYESDVEEERGRVRTLLENLRIEADVLVFWLASGDLPIYEVIINGTSGLQAEKEVDECLSNEDWWQEIQKIRGNRDTTGTEYGLSDMASVYQAGQLWPESSFQQGPRTERVERFLGLRKLLKKSKRKHTMSGLTKLGVSLGIRTQRLAPDIVQDRAVDSSESDGSESGSAGDSDTEDDGAGDSDERESAASEGDLDNFTTDDESPERAPIKITRRRSHGDSMRGPPPSKKSTGEQEPSIRNTSTQKATAAAFASEAPLVDISTTTNEEVTKQGPAIVTQKPASITVCKAPTTVNEQLEQIPAPSLAGSRPSSSRSKTHDQSLLGLANRPTTNKSAAERPALSRHASMPKFSSKPVPMTRVATEDGPGPSINWEATPSPPPRRHRLPSAYRARNEPMTFPDRISEVSENEVAQSPPHSPAQSASPLLSRRGSTYSTQAVPLSFNDLPCRAQHLILNELIRLNSEDTAVLMTTLPSPIEGTCHSEAASLSYLDDLEVLCQGCPPTLLVHSNSMTVTMSL